VTKTRQGDGSCDTVLLCRFDKFGCLAGIAALSGLKYLLPEVFEVACVPGGAYYPGGVSLPHGSAGDDKIEVKPYVSLF
jgi:hypothetical protein